VTTEVSGPAVLDGRVALVTGAARGIGLAIARVLARAGADVGLIDIFDLGAAQRAVEAEGRQAWPLILDLADRAAVRQRVAEFVTERARLDVLVNNAGLVSTTPLAELSDDEWDHVVAVNLTAAVVATQAVWPTMVAQGGGKVVFMGSRAGRMGGNNAGPAYVATKGALHSLVVSVAKEGAPHGILSNGVAPGPIKTEMTVFPSYADEKMVTPLGRMGRPEDIAEAVLYLASPASNFVTGTVLNVSGGALMGW
jgi:3-oxoacyl-[acyl-carrier protein] reductase